MFMRSPPGDYSSGYNQPCFVCSKCPLSMLKLPATFRSSGIKRTSQDLGFQYRPHVFAQASLFLCIYALDGFEQYFLNITSQRLIQRMNTLLLPLFIHLGGGGSCSLQPQVSAHDTPLSVRNSVFCRPRYLALSEPSRIWSHMFARQVLLPR